MDPLSILASTITLASVVSYGLEKIRELHGAANEVYSLMNEVTDLKLILLDAEHFVTQRQNNTAQGRDQWPADKVVQLLVPAKEKLHELEKLINDLLKTPRAVGGRCKPARLAWLRNKSKITKTVLELKEIRANLPVLWGTSQLKGISQIQLRLDEVTVLQTSQLQQLSDQNNALQLLSENFAQVTVPDSHPATSIGNDVGNNEGRIACANNALDLIPRHESTEAVPGSEGCTRSASYTAVRIRASRYRRHRCDGWCSCRCHKPRKLQSPDQLASVLGNLLVGYSGFKFFSPATECSERKCRRQSIPTFKLNYYFPNWMLARAFQATFLMSCMGGPELVLRCPRVVPDDSPLMFQAVQGNLTQIKVLFDKGMASPYDVASSNGRTALHYAVSYGHRELSQFLLDTGASPHVEDKNQLTPVTFAWERVFGLQSKASATADEWRCMFDSEEYLESRTFPALHKIVLGLVGADLRSHLSSSTATIDDTDADGRTALSWAAGKGDLDAVQTLLDYGADPTIRSTRQQTALVWAAQSSSASRCSIIRRLLDHGCKTTWHDHRHRLPLFYSADDVDDPEVLQLLLADGADINWRDYCRRTALGYAVKSNRPRNTRFLLSHGADAGIADHWGFTPWIEAVYQNHHDILQILLEAAHDEIPRHRTASGMGMLHVAAVHGDERTLSLLSKADASGLDPADLDSSGRTAADLFSGREDVSDALRSAFLTLVDATAGPEFQDAQDHF